MHHFIYKMITTWNQLIDIQSNSIQNSVETDRSSKSSHWRGWSEQTFFLINDFRYGCSMWCYLIFLLWEILWHHLNCGIHPFTVIYMGVVDYEQNWTVAILDLCLISLTAGSVTSLKSRLKTYAKKNKLVFHHFNVFYLFRYHRYFHLYCWVFYSSLF